MNFNINATKVFFPASGYRNTTDGSFFSVGSWGYYWSSGPAGCNLNFSSGHVTPKGGDPCAFGMPVRCVEGVSIGTTPTAWTDVAAAGATTDVIVSVGGANGWTASFAPTAGFTASPLSGKSGDKITLTWADNSAEGSPARSASIILTANGSAKTHTLVCSQNGEFMTLNGLKWTTGNLIADGANGCKVGAPGDGGLYFQYGGLIGYKGGANGDGVGIVNAALHPNGKWWNGAAAYSATDIAVTPTGYTSPTNVWPFFEVASGKYGYYYYTGFTTKYADFQKQANGKNVAQGIGDPCEVYLGSPWRLPKYDELSAITGSVVENAWVSWATAGITGKWTASGPQSSAGAWFGPNSRTGNPTTTTDLFIPASGHRNTDGTFTWVGTYGLLWSSSVYDYRSGFHLDTHESGGVVPRFPSYRAHAFPVRCVQ